MLRRLFSVLSALSLLLCAAASALWVLSYIREDVVELGNRPGEHTIMSRRGRVVEGWNHNESWPYPHRKWERLGFGGGGFLYKYYDEDIAWTSHAYWRWRQAPYWAACLLLSLAPLLWAGAWVRRSHLRRLLRRTGLCPQCAYDRRATPARCPECGSTTPVAP